MVNHDVTRLSYRDANEGTGSVFSFLDTQLRRDFDFSIENEFPSLFGDAPGGTSFVVKRDEKVVSHAGLVVREFFHGTFHFKVGLLGSVTTLPEFRGMGMAKAVLGEALQELKNQGCLFAVLWSDQTDFYRPLGFIRAGKETDFLFEKTDASPPVEPVVPFDFKNHAHWIWRLYQRHEVRVDRSLEEQKRLLTIPRTRVFVSLKDGQVVAYLVINKGADFTDYIHEWGGDPEIVSRGVVYLQNGEYSDRSLTLISPSHYDLTSFRRYAVKEVEGVLGLIKLMDRPKLLDLDAAYAHTQALSPSLNASQSDEELITSFLGRFPFFLWGFDSI